MTSSGPDGAADRWLPARWPPARWLPVRWLRSLVVLNLLLLAIFGPPAAAAPVGPRAQPAQQAAAARPVVVLGIAGLRWSDVTPSGTPAIWRHLQSAALGSLVVRTAGPLTCPADGWLTLGAGRRAQAQAGGRSLAGCREVPVQLVPPPGGSAATVPSWGALQRHNDSLPYGAALGLLAHAARASGPPVAVGQGAALALAGQNGTVQRYLEGVGRPLPTGSTLTVVDLGWVRDPLAAGGTPRSEQALKADRRFASALATVPDGARTLLLGLADGSDTSHLGVAALLIADGPPGWLTSRSTRQPGLILLTDIAPTVLSLLGHPIPTEMTGAVLGASPRHGEPSAAVERLRDADLAATTVRRMLSPFFTGLVLLQLLLYAAAGLLIRRSWGGPAGRRPVLRGLRVLGVALALVPVATYLAQLAPWWRSPWPLAAVTGLALAWTVGVAVGCLAARWRSPLLWPPALVGAVTAVVLGADVATGSRLQQASLMGYTPVVAGRFYGFGNVAFAVFATASLVVAGSCGGWLVRRGRRRLAVGAVAIVGVAAVTLDGPVGTDFGGVIALVPAFAVLGLGIAGLRLTWRRGLLVALSTVVAVTMVAVLDWLRPSPSRTHLGRFVGQVLDGSAWQVVQRKAEANLNVLFTFLGVVVPFAVAFLVLVLLRGLPWRGPVMRSMLDNEPMLRPLLWSVATVAVLGFAVNDSGIAIPAVVCMLAVPLLIAVAADSLLREDAPSGRRADLPP